MGPLQARLIGSIFGALTLLVGLLGIDATTDVAIAVIEALAVAIVGFLSFLAYGLSHKMLDKGRDG